MIANEIEVTVCIYGLNRPFLMMRYQDPVTGRRHARSTGTNNRRATERKAAVWQDELNSGRYQAPNRVTWDEFRERYEDEKLSTLAKKTQDAASSAMNHFERVVGPLTEPSRGV